MPDFTGFRISFARSCQVTLCRCPSPSNATISVNGRSVIAGLSSIRRIRYRDMLSRQPRAPHQEMHMLRQA